MSKLPWLLGPHSATSATIRPKGKVCQIVQQRRALCVRGGWCGESPAGWRVIPAPPRWSSFCLSPADHRATQAIGSVRTISLATTSSFPAQGSRESTRQNSGYTGRGRRGRTMVRVPDRGDRRGTLWLRLSHLSSCRARIRMPESTCARILAGGMWPVVAGRQWSPSVSSPRTRSCGPVAAISMPGGVLVASWSGRWIAPGLAWRGSLCLDSPAAPILWTASRCAIPTESPRGARTRRAGGWGQRWRFEGHAGAIQGQDLCRRGSSPAASATRTASKRAFPTIRRSGVWVTRSCGCAWRAPVTSSPGASKPSLATSWRRPWTPRRTIRRSPTFRRVSC